MQGPGTNQASGEKGKTRTAAPKQRAATGKKTVEDSAAKRNALNNYCVTIWNYIDVLKKVERRFPDISPVNMVTALRKVWNGTGYDNHKFDRLLYYARHKQLDLEKRDRRGYRLLDHPRDQRILAGIQCLRTDLHGCIDFGHTLCGIDAWFHPWAKRAPLPELNTQKKVLAAITWAGDVGSVYDEMTEKKKSISEFRTYWRGYAHEDDLYGDVDGVVFVKELHMYRDSLPGYFKKKPSQGGGLAGALEFYYGGPGTGAMSQRQVFETFVKLYPIEPLSKVKLYVKAFVDALHAGTPTWNEDLMNMCCIEWQNFVKRHLYAHKNPKAVTSHACKNDGDPPRITYNRNGQGLHGFQKRVWSGDKPLPGWKGQIAPHM